MKLRNKNTGNIIDAVMTGENEIEFQERGSFAKYSYASLAELNNEWEDYEETKYYFIDGVGIIRERRIGECEEDEEARKIIGNYFDTKEEAEKAVEKLKAWKRLKDNGLKFCAWKITDDGCSVDIETTLDSEVVRAKQKYITDDLNLIFGEEA